MRYWPPPWSSAFDMELAVKQIPYSCRPSAAFCGDGSLPDDRITSSHAAVTLKLGSLLSLPFRDFYNLRWPLGGKHILYFCGKCCAYSSLFRRFPERQQPLRCAEKNRHRTAKGFFRWPCILTIWLSRLFPSEGLQQIPQQFILYFHRLLSFYDPELFWPILGKGPFVEALFPPETAPKLNGITVYFSLTFGQTNTP